MLWKIENNRTIVCSPKDFENETQIKGKNSLPLNPFLFVFYLKRIRSFEFWAFTPNPSAQNPKQKTNLLLLNKKPVKMKLNEKYFSNSV